jgi:hypothetical protein
MNAGVFPKDMVCIREPRAGGRCEARFGGWPGRAATVARQNIGRREKMNSRDTEHLIEALSSNWQAEMRGYHTYNTLSQQENVPNVVAHYATWRWPRSTMPNYGPGG